MIALWSLNNLKHSKSLADVLYFFKPFKVMHKDPCGYKVYRTLKWQKQIAWGAGEMPPRLLVHSSLTENQILVSITHIGRLTTP